MEEEKKNSFSPQEVEEITFLGGIERELELVERSFDSGDMQAFGRNRDEIMHRFVEFRQKDEKVFQQHCNCVFKYYSDECITHRSYSMKQPDGEGDEDEKRDLEQEKQELLQSRKAIQEKVEFTNLN